MLCHWRYVLDNLFGEVESVSCLGATHVPERWDENNEPYEATADDAAYATFELAGDIVAHIGAILSQVSSPVIIHWLGEMFDPALSGYWGHRNLDAATEVCLSLINDYAGKIDGIKVSLLDAGREVEIRRRLGSFV